MERTRTRIEAHFTLLGLTWVVLATGGLVVLRILGLPPGCMSVARGRWDGQEVTELWSSEKNQPIDPKLQDAVTRALRRALAEDKARAREQHREDREARHAG
jgi:hypothetical protein